MQNKAQDHEIMNLISQDILVNVDLVVYDRGYNISCMTELLIFQTGNESHRH
jgi:hypothetical protein